MDKFLLLPGTWTRIAEQLLAHPGLISTVSNKINESQVEWRGRIEGGGSGGHLLKTASMLYFCSLDHKTTKVYIIKVAPYTHEKDIG